MRLQDQVTSVELSNKLHILGVTAPSMFYREWQGAKENEIEINKTPDYCPDTVNCYSVAELGNLLPGHLPVDNHSSFKWWLGCNKLKLKYRVSYYYGLNPDFGKFLKYFQENTEADARAKMLIYLLENKLITL